MPWGGKKTTGQIRWKNVPKILSMRREYFDEDWQFKRFGKLFFFNLNSYIAVVDFYVTRIKESDRDLRELGKANILSRSLLVSKMNSTLPRNVNSINITVYSPAPIGPARLNYYPKTGKRGVKNSARYQLRSWTWACIRAKIKCERYHRGGI